MKITGRLLVVAVLGAVLSLAPRSMAAVTAYDNPAGQPGNQAYSGSLGLDFDVLSDPIDILSLGVFDAGQNGLNRPISVSIYDRTTETVVVSIPTFVFSGALDALINGSRFRALTIPATLGPGQYSVVASGYGAGELNGNAGCVGNGGSCFGANVFTASTMNTAGGLINFVGGGRYGTAGAFPTVVDSGPVNRYLAGTFTFQATIAEIPEPATFGLLGLSLTGLALVAQRRRT